MLRILIRTSIVGAAAFAVFFGSDLALIREDSGLKEAVASIIEALVTSAVAFVVQLIRNS